ncbi:MAG: BREX system Lon protease-like protein BrxL [Cetobacterium sp.]
MKIINPMLCIRETQNNNSSYLETQGDFIDLFTEQNILDTFKNFYKEKNIVQKFDWILNSIGISSTENNLYTIMTELTKLLPFIQANYNLILIGESGLGKSSIYSLVLPFAKIVSGIPTTAALRGNERKSDSDSDLPLLQNNVLVLEEVADCSNAANSIPLLKNTLSSCKFLKNNRDELKTTCSIVVTSNEYSSLSSYKDISKNLYTPLASGIKDLAFLNRFNGTLLHYNNIFHSRVYTKSETGIHCQQLYKLFCELKNFPNKSYFSNNSKDFSARETSNINSTINGFVKLFYLDNEPEEDFLNFITEWAKYILSLNTTKEEKYYPFTLKSLSFISKFFFMNKRDCIEYICFLSKSRLLVKFKDDDLPTNSQIIALDGFGIDENNYDLNFIKNNHLNRDFLTTLYKDNNFKLSLKIMGKIATSKKFKTNGTLVDSNSDQDFNNLLLDHIETHSIFSSFLSKDYRFKGIPNFYEKIIENKAANLFNLQDSSYINKSCYILNDKNFVFINYHKLFNK